MGLRDEQRRLVGEAWKDLLQPRLRERLAELRKERDAYEEALERRGSIKAEIERIKESLEIEKCAVCGQTIHLERREELGAQLGMLEVTLASLTSDTAQMGDVAAEISNLASLRSGGAGAALRHIEQELTRSAVAMTSLEGELADLKAKVAGHDNAEIARIRKVRDLKNQNLGGIIEDIRRVETMIEEDTAKQARLSKLMSKAPTARTQRSALEVEVYGVLERVFAAGVDVLRERLRSKVEQAASRAFLALTTEKTYRGLKINKSYGLTIIDREGRSVPVRSAGAEQIVALSLVDGLNRVGRKAGPIIMDTPLGRLDPTHRINVLRYVPTMAEQVVLLVHEGEIDPDEDLGVLAAHVGARYQIDFVTSSESRLVRMQGDGHE